MKTAHTSHKIHNLAVRLQRDVDAILEHFEHDISAFERRFHEIIDFDVDAILKLELPTKKQGHRTYYHATLPAAHPPVPAHHSFHQKKQKKASFMDRLNAFAQTLFQVVMD